MCILQCSNKLVICAKRDRICINMTGQIVVFAVFIYFYQYILNMVKIEEKCYV